MKFRLGVTIGEYQQNCRDNAKYLARHLAGKIKPDSRILLLGTEEFMYPVLLLGEELAGQGWASEVFCHATTRSPIGIGQMPDYPIRNGYHLHSFYVAECSTYIYNLAAYDAAVILSDTTATEAGRLALADLLGVLREQGCQQMFYVQGGQNVQHL